MARAPRDLSRMMRTFLIDKQYKHVNKSKPRPARRDLQESDPSVALGRLNVGRSVCRSNF